MTPPALDPQNHAADHAKLRSLVDAIETIFHGKRRAVELTLTALLAEGHVLFEDVPGVGKTTLARSVARALGCAFRRVQFTSDLLPSDIVGVSVFDQRDATFRFEPGPLFANLVLADEINRTTPRTQSALLEAMSEGTVSVDTTTHALPKPFIVMATQNPLEFAGTYPLPESQMDRFLVRVTIGYPDERVERDVIRTLGFRDAAETVREVLQADEVAQMQTRVRLVKAADVVMDYLQALVRETRSSRYLSLGLSTRGAIALYRAAQGRAYLDGRDHILPDDVKALLVPVGGHRVTIASQRDAPAERREEAMEILREILETTPVPL